MSAQARDNDPTELRPDPSFEEAALFYAEMGLRVFPTRPGTKEPYANKDHGLSETDKGKGGYHVATCDPAIIRSWAKRWPQANIGIAIDGFIVVEADVRHDGPATLHKFCTQHGVVLDTVEARSASGGPHYFFRDVPGLRRAINALPGVDVLTSGKGYALVSPSRKGTGVYAWVKGRAPWEREMAELPAALRMAAERRHDGRAYSYKAKDAAAGCSSAARSQNVTDVAAYMRKVCDNVATAISGVKEGERRETLNRESFTLGRFVGAGHITRSEARSIIESAYRRAGHRLDNKAEDTIDVALDEGAAQPIRLIIEERTYTTPNEWDDPVDNDDDDDSPSDTSNVVDVGILQRLKAERAAHKETRRKLEGYLRLMRDPRVAPAQKVTTMLAWDESGGPPKNLYTPTDDDPTDNTAPIEDLEQRGYQRLYIKSTAEGKAGMNPRVFGRTIDDAASIGLLKIQTRTEAKQVPLDPDIDISSPSTPDGAIPAIKAKCKYITAIYVKPGAIPPREGKTLKEQKEAVQKKAVRLVADAGRKEPRCPGCGSRRLKGVMYQCESCHSTCTREEAEHAGQTIKRTKAGLWVNEHGELLHSGKQQWGSEGVWQDDDAQATADAASATDEAQGRIPTTDTVDTASAETETPKGAGSPVYVSSPLIAQKRGEETYNAPLGSSAEEAGRIPTMDIATSEEGLQPEPPPSPPCRYPSHRGRDWLRPDGSGPVCGVCHPQPPPRALHIPKSAAPGQGQGVRS